MDTIFRQPGKTGMENFKNIRLTEEIVDCINGVKSLRKRKMKLNSIIFYLCAGMCSSALIDNAFSMDPKREIRNKTCKIDSYSMMVASKYFKTMEDFANIEMANSKFGENIDKFHFNPISITPNQLHMWPNLETLHLYTDNDIKTWMNYNGDMEKIFKIELWTDISDIDAVDLSGDISRKWEGMKATFRNVRLRNPDILGEVDRAGNYKFNDDVYTAGKQKDAKFVIKTIDDGVFRGNSKLMSITIPDSVESIERSAFCGCGGLTSIKIPNSVEYIECDAFCGCGGLTSITIPDSVTYIGRFAFAECTGLKSITIPDGVTCIYNRAFEGCDKAEFIVPSDGMRNYLRDYCHINEGSIKVKEELFNQENAWKWPENGRLIIPQGVTSIKNRMFADRADIKSITIPDSVESIEWGAFKGCTGLTSITIPNSVKEIEYGAFQGCTGLTSITIPNSLESIGGSAFRGCTGLTKVTIPDSVTSIGNETFEGCDNAEFIVPSDGMRNYLRDHCHINEGSIKVKEELFNQENAWKWPENGRLIIPQGVTSIKSSMFADRGDIKFITIPDSVASIDYCAFYGCTGLTSIKIPNSVKEIECGAFDGCTGLKSITIANSLESIGEYAFQCCKELTSVTIPDSVTSIGNGVFWGCDKLDHIYVYSDRVRQLVIDSESGINADIIEVIKTPDDVQE